MRFIYKAKKGLSDTVEGVIEADNREEAFNRLLGQELFPVSIMDAETGRECPRQNHSRKWLVFGKKIGSREILDLTRKLTTFARAKVELLASLRIIYEQTENAFLKEVILEIYNAVKEGKTFSESLERFPKIFPGLYVNIIKAGEASGRLDVALERISEFMHREENLKTKVAVALAYPGLLLSVGSASILVLMNFVIPKLKPIFEGLGNDLPFITKLVLNISGFSHRTWFWIFGIIAVSVSFLYYQKDNAYFISLWRRIKAGFPIIKRLMKNQELAHFSRSLGLLLNSGVSALRSLEVASLAVDDPKLRRELKAVYQKVAAGESLSKSMSDLTGLPGFFIKMVAVGEESGKLGEILDEITRSYNQQIEVDIMLISSLLEPLLILGLGVVLGAIILSILLPTFQITQAIR